MTNLPNEQEIRHNSNLIISMMMEFFYSSEIHLPKEFVDHARHLSKINYHRCVRYPVDDWICSIRIFFLSPYGK